ncbi:MAG: hypothetical protein WCX97_05345 [Candidatus Magasanikbacteria bacterium]
MGKRGNNKLECRVWNGMSRQERLNAVSPLEVMGMSHGEIQKTLGIPSNNAVVLYRYLSRASSPEMERVRDLFVGGKLNDAATQKLIQLSLKTIRIILNSMEQGIKISARNIEEIYHQEKDEKEKVVNRLIESAAPFSTMEHNGGKSVTNTINLMISDFPPGGKIRISFDPSGAILVERIEK